MICRASTWEAEMQIQNREMQLRKFYCWMGILLGCVAVLLALGVGPVKLYQPESGTTFGAIHDMSHQTALADKTMPLAQR
jgi:hypothetical protein